MEFYIPYGKKNGLIVSKDDMQSKPLSSCRAIAANYGADGSVGIWAETFKGKGMLLPWGKYVLMITQEEDGETGQQLFDRVTKTEEAEEPKENQYQWKHATYEKP